MSRQIPATSGNLALAIDWSERREHVRRKTLLSGRLVFNNGWGAIDCSIKDLSEGGAKIRIGGWLNLPKEVELHLDRGDKYRCERIRFVNDFLCVRFLEVLTDRGSAQADAGRRRSQESSPRIAAV
ncbi:MAG: PilZ domain-containing protein [Alphaproteobacteria bacterium]|jgi:hypothetical protein|nr:PilZ domain-containing protein [Alphaproteobacteria bacterium]